MSVTCYVSGVRNVARGPLCRVSVIVCRDWRDFCNASLSSVDLLWLHVGEMCSSPNLVGAHHEFGDRRLRCSYGGMADVSMVIRRLAHPDPRPRRLRRIARCRGVSLNTVRVCLYCQTLYLKRAIPDLSPCVAAVRVNEAPVFTSLLDRAISTYLQNAIRDLCSAPATLVDARHWFGDGRLRGTEGFELRCRPRHEGDGRSVF